MTDIVIGDIRPRIQAVGDGVQTSFVYPFPIFDQGDLEVWLDSTLQTTDFTITGAGTSEGGTVDFVTAPANDVVVTLRRRITIERLSDFAEGGAFRAKVINRELDEIIAIQQQIADDQGRALMLAPEDGDAALLLPLQGQRAGKVMAFDASGNVIASVDVSTIESFEGAVDTAQTAATDAVAAKDDAEAAAAAAATFDPALYRALADLIESVDLANGAVTQDKIDPSVQLGGPGIGDTGQRINDPYIGTDTTLWDLNNTFTVDAGADTLSVGTDEKFKNGDIVYLETDGTLPAGLVVETPYRVVNAAAATLQLSATFGGAAIDITDAGTGAHTIYKAVNVNAAGPITIESGFTVTVKPGCTWRVG